MIHLKYYELLKDYNQLIDTKNNINPNFYNGIIDRYMNPVITRNHIPIHWRYDISNETNPYFQERLGINATFNAGAIYYNDEFHLAVRVEGTDRKSFFAIAKSKSGIDGFEFVGEPLTWDDIDSEETNIYDIRLTKHEDGYIYGVYCSESKDKSVNDSSSAIAKAGLIRTTDLVSWERLPNIQTLQSPQQRNVVLHEEFIDGKYAFYTRPQDGFITTGSGGGIAIGLCDDILNPIINEERVIDNKHYHTNYEVKNGQGPAPIKTDKGWIHIAHGVRNTAAGLRYVLYLFVTSLDNPYEVIAKPSGYLLAPLGGERVGDVSNVLFTNGVIKDANDNVYIYYASSDTRLHVATTTIEKLLHYAFNTEEDAFRSLDCAKQRIKLIRSNLELLRHE